eukprot:1576553-Rhodomonas_salina.1
MEEVRQRIKTKLQSDAGRSSQNMVENMGARVPILDVEFVRQLLTAWMCNLAAAAGSAEDKRGYSWQMVCSKPVKEFVSFVLES